MLTALHLADVHLDTAFEGRSAQVRERLREALRQAVRRAVDTALDEAVDVVLIAGDLFDGDRLSFVTETFLVDQLQRLADADVPVVVVTGNHDPGGTGQRATQIDWPSTTRVVDTREPQWIDVTGSDGRLRGRIAAAGHVSAREDRNLAAAFPVAPDGPDRDVPHVGLLHAHVTSAAQVDAHDRYAPCTVDDLRRPGYDYWALGHIHARQQVDAEAHAWYAGNVQGRTPRETGVKGGLLVRVTANEAPEVSVCPLAPVRWEHLRLDDLADVASVQGVADRVRAALASRRDDETAATDWLLRVTLSGPSPLADALDAPDAVADLEQAVTDRLGVLDVEVRTGALTPPVDVDAYRGETHLAGEVLDVLDAARTDDAVLDAVAPDVLAGLDTDDPDARRDYLRTLLDGLDRDAIHRLLREE